MYIRRTTIKSRQTGEPYYTYRLVESIREGAQVRQRTLLNLGRHFEVPREQWAALVQRIEQLVSGQPDLMPADLDAQWEEAAQRYAAQLIRTRASVEEGRSAQAADYQNVDVDSLDLLRPRSVAIEHVALAALRQVGLDKKLAALGFNGPQQAAAIGTLVARMAAPGSELATHQWLQEQSALGELIDYDFLDMDLMALYRISDQLLKHKEALEGFLYEQERTLFDFEEVITLYDLTNTYCEGTAKGNANAALGRSKEKRSDCPLVTLALVLDASGFPKRSEIFAGNVSEPKTLEKMLGKLTSEQTQKAPTVVLDAGIASEENIAWLVENGYRYLVVSRKRHREFDPDQASLIKEDGDLRIQAQRRVNADTGEVELYCHSSQREKKERGIAELFAKRFEAALAKLAEGLHKKGCIKRYDKVLERLGRLREKYARAAQYYDDQRRARRGQRQGHRHPLATHQADRADPTRGLLPAHQRGRVGRGDLVADLHHAHGLGGGLSLPQIRARTAPHLPSQDRSGERTSVHLRARLPSGTHDSLPAQGRRDPSELGGSTPCACRAGSRHRHPQTRRRQDGPYPQSHPRRASPAGYLQRTGCRQQAREN